MKKPHPLLKAIEIAGSESALARAIGYHPSAISKAKKVEYVSVEMAARIDIATKGKVSSHQLRPDIFPAPVSLPRRKKAA